MKEKGEGQSRNDMRGGEGHEIVKEEGKKERRKEGRKGGRKERTEL